MGVDGDWTKQKGNILKTHLDYAAQEMIQEVNLSKSSKNKIDMQNVLKFGETAIMNDLFPHETSQNYDLLKNYERMKSIHKEYGLVKAQNLENEQQNKKEFSNEDTFEIPLEIPSAEFLKSRKLQGETNWIGYVMDKDGKIMREERKDINAQEVAREIIEPRFKMFIEHCKINHLKTFKDNIQMFNTH